MLNFYVIVYWCPSHL